jgi:hypothetical protein
VNSSGEVLYTLYPRLRSIPPALEKIPTIVPIGECSSTTVFDRARLDGGAYTKTVRTPEKYEVVVYFTGGFTVSEFTTALTLTAEPTPDPAIGSWSGEMCTVYGGATAVEMKLEESSPLIIASKKNDTLVTFAASAGSAESGSRQLSSSVSDVTSVSYIGYVPLLSDLRGEGVVVRGGEVERRGDER